MENFIQITTENFENFINGSWDYDKEKECLTGRGKRCFPATDTVKKEKLEKEFLEMINRYKEVSL